MANSKSRTRTYVSAAILSWALLLSPPPPAIGGPAQDVVRVRIRMMLVLKDLTLRPVPRQQLQIEPTSNPTSPSPEAIKVTTGFEGIAEAALPPGSYRVIAIQ